MIPSFCQQRHRHHRNGWPRARAPEAALQLDLEQDHHVNPMRSSSNNKNSTPFNAQFGSVRSLLSIFVSESLSDFSADQAPPSPLPCGVYAWVPHSDPCRYDPNPGRDRRRRETLINNILHNAMMLQPDAAAAAATPAMASSRYALAILAIINVAVAGEQSLGNTAVPSAFREAPEFRNGVGCAAPAGGSGSASFSSPSSWSSSWCGDASAVHIAMTLDAHYLRGSMAAVLSVLRHTGCPENVVFHLLMPQADFAALQAVVRATFPYLRFRAYPFQEARVRGLISESVREALENPLNYARSYLADMLPRCLRRVIYLDSDLIVLDDIARLWETRLAGRPIAAPEYCHANFSQYFTPAFWADERLARAAFRRGGAAGGRPRRRRPCYFNTGVMVIDLALWRRSGFTRRIEAWMGVQRRRRIYELGSLPPFLLVFAGQVRPVEHRWNQHGLGGDNVSGRCRPLHAGPVSLLHWSGKGKPWLRLDAKRPCPMDALWAPYDLYQNHRYP